MNEFGTNTQDEEALPDLPPVTTGDYVREVPEYAKTKALDPDKVTYNEPRVRIVLEDGDHIPPSGQFFGINGNGFILKPGKEADVPVGIVDILNHAVMAEPVVDETTKQVLRFRERLRFPYRVLAHIAKGSVVQRAKLS